MCGFIEEGEEESSSGRVGTKEKLVSPIRQRHSHMLDDNDDDDDDDYDDDRSLDYFEGYFQLSGPP